LVPLIARSRREKQNNPAKRLATVSIANAAFAFDFLSATAIGKATEALRFGKREPRSRALARVSASARTSARQQIRRPGRHKR